LWGKALTMIDDIAPSTFKDLTCKAIGERLHGIRN
jgi:hypothetical protein